MQTNYEKVIEFNKQFGIKLFTNPQYEILETDSKLIEYRMNLIREEIKELNEAVSQNNIIEIIDALADILYVVYGMGVSVGFDVDKAYIGKTFDEKGNLTNYQTTMLFHGEIDSNNFTKKISEIDIENESFKIFLEKVNNLLELLEKYVLEKNYNNMTHMLIEIIFTTYTLGYFMKVDMDKAFDIVHKSNMSKLCNDEKSAAETVEWYLQNGPKDPNTNELLYKKPAYRKSYDDKYYVVYDVEKTKILKSIYYTEANFMSLFS